MLKEMHSFSFEEQSAVKGEALEERLSVAHEGELNVEAAIEGEALEGRAINEK